MKYLYNIDPILKTLPAHIRDSEAPWTEIESKEIGYTIYLDKYPCTPGHRLFVPNFNTFAAFSNCFKLAFMYGQEQVDTGEWDGFNIGFNYGKAAGQTVNWPHIHLIPRREGDVEDPVGGVRNTIPGKCNYKR